MPEFMDYYDYVHDWNHDTIASYITNLYEFYEEERKKGRNKRRCLYQIFLLYVFYDLEQVAYLSSINTLLYFNCMLS